MDSKPRYIMIGGFLGAGKTTAIARLAHHLTTAGRRVGLITNDQGAHLADTAVLGAHGFPVEEITGGCFCCKFDALVGASQQLCRSTRPDVIITEPVGSCTDLKATVSYPLRRGHADDFDVAPYSVLVDPLRALRVLGVEPGAVFSPQVRYIYRKQLEEAEVLVVNKIDLLTPERLAALTDALRREFPGADVMAVSVRQETGLDAWFDRLVGGAPAGGAAMDVDYDQYAEGEALLGWLNAAIRVRSSHPFDANMALPALARDLRHRLGREGVEIAHLKMTLTPDGGGGGVATLNLVRGDGRVEQSHRLAEPIQGGEWIVNLRAEGDPEVLKFVLMESLSAFSQGHSGIETRVEHLESFRPGRPQPTHRVTAMSCVTRTPMPPQHPLALNPNQPLQ